MKASNILKEIPDKIFKTPNLGHAARNIGHAVNAAGHSIYKVEKSQLGLATDTIKNLFGGSFNMIAIIIVLGLGYLFFKR